MVRYARLRAALPVLVLAAGLLTACGSSDDDPARDGLSGDEQTAADNLAAQILRSRAVAGRTAEDSVTEEQAICIAEGAVTGVGLEALQDYGILTEQLKVNKGIQGVAMTAPHAGALAGAFAGCLDVEELFEQQLTAAKGLSKAQQACIREAVTEAAAREVLALSFQGRTRGLYDGLRDSTRTCQDDKPRPR